MTLNIGIDLGTTYSCLAYIDSDGNVVVSKDSEGRSIMPSVVLFKSRGEMIVGYEAKESAADYPSRYTIESIKRQMGDSESGCTIFDRRLAPPTISAAILKKVMEPVKGLIEEEGLGNVVITHPAYFGASQVNATREAGIIAGIPDDHLFLIDEPTAAAIAEDRDSALHSTVMVYDLGGGTFDVSILKVEDGGITCIATDGNRYLGGKDWDNMLINHCISLIEEKTDEAITSDYFEAGSDFYSIVKFAVEGIKKELSERPSVHHTFRFGDEEVEIVVSRRDFENISSGYVRRTIEIMQNCIRESGISENELDEIILTGGSTRMPMIIRAVKDRFPNNEIRPCFDPDESVARGAAIYSDLLDTLEDDEGSESSSQIQCVMSKTYGIISLDKNGEKVVSNILFRNTTLPIVGASKTYRVPCDCDVIQIDVYENEGTVEEKTMNLENSGQVCIGNFNVQIRGLKEGECMTVTLGVDEQKALSCTAIYKGQEFYHQFSPNSAMTEEEMEDACSLLMLMDE